MAWWSFLTNFFRTKHTVHLGDISRSRKKDKLVLRNQIRFKPAIYGRAKKTQQAIHVVDVQTKVLSKEDTVGKYAGPFGETKVYVGGTRVPLQFLLSKDVALGDLDEMTDVRYLGDLLQGYASKEEARKGHFAMCTRIIEMFS